MMLKAVIYGYMNNVYSCRKIEERLVRDVHFIWLAGYEHPDYITINRFRNRVKKEINAVFTPAGNASSSALEFYAVFMQMMPLSGMTK